MRDYICPDCGGLVTCLLCVEINAGHMLRGPAFVAQPHNPDWYPNQYLRQPKPSANPEQTIDDENHPHFETIGADPPLSLDITHFAHSIPERHDNGAFGETPPLNKTLFG